MLSNIHKKNFFQIKYFVLSILLSIVFSGCMQKQPPLNSNISGVTPKIFVKSNDLELIKSNIIRQMRQKNFRLINDNKYMMDFRRQLGSENSFQRALMSSMDGRQVNDIGTEYYLSKRDNGYEIEIDGYMWATFKYNSRAPEKMPIRNNKDLNSMYENYLVPIKRKVEATSE